MQKPNICFIDGDILAYRSAAAAEKRYIIAKHKSSGREMRFDNRTEFWGRGKELGGYLAKVNFEKETNFTKKDFEVTDHSDLEPVENSLHIAKSTINGLLKTCDVPNYKIYLETDSSTNFRKDVATICKYKDRETEKPKHLTAVKDYLIAFHDAEMSDYFETDELIIMDAYKHNGIQVSIDKDAWQASGTWIYDWTKMDKPFYIPKQGVGKIWKDEKGKVRAFGLKSFCLQMLIGDKTDSIFPTKLCGENFGEVSAFKLLDTLETPLQCLERVEEKYKEWYPDIVTYPHWKTGKMVTKDWLEIAEEMFSLLWMKRSPDETMSFKRLLEENRIQR